MWWMGGVWFAGACAHWPELPAEGQVVTGDVGRFWEAVDAGATAEDFETYYLEPGSDGLDSLRAARWKNAETLAAAFASFEEWYRAGRERSLAVAEGSDTREAVREVYEAAELLWEGSVYPPVTFAFGDMNTGGTMTSKGLVIGVELFLDAEDAPRGELTDWHLAVVRSTDALPAIVAHEHGHAQQELLTATFGANLLERSLLEGIADWFGAQTWGATPTPGIDEYGFEHERELWEEFSAVMFERDYSGWLYNGADAAERPADLG